MNVDDVLIEEAVSVPQPPGLKLELGYRLKMPVELPGVLWMTHGIYRRYGFKHEVHEWLLSQVGETCAFAEWNDGKGDWIHTGCQFKSNGQRGQGQCLANFWFKDKSKAMLFKLTWFGRA